MRQLINDYIRTGIMERSRTLSRKRKNEIKCIVNCTKSIKLRVNNIYRQNFKDFKSQWSDNSIPCEHDSDFWEKVLYQTQHEIMAQFETNIVQIKTLSEEYFAKWDCICEGYLESYEFSLVIKQLKNEWKKELIGRDFK